MFEIYVVGAVVPEVEQGKEEGINKNVCRSFDISVYCNGAE